MSWGSRTGPCPTPFHPARSKGSGSRPQPGAIPRCARDGMPVSVPAPCSMEIPRLRAQAAEHRAQVLQVARDEVFDAVHALPAPAHGQQGRAEQRLAPALRDAWPDDDVDHAVLVLQGDENRAAGGSGALALGDDAGGVDAAAVALAVQV